MYSNFFKIINERGISSYRVAKETGIPPSTFSDWKSGKSKPKVDKLQKLADYFGVGIDYFLYEETTAG